MKKLLLPLLLLVLGLTAWWLWKNNTGTTLAGPLSDFAVTDTAAVDRIFIADKQGRTADLRRATLTGGEAGWTVNGLPAKSFQVQLLLKTFRLVEIRGPVPKSAEENVLRVMAGTARKVEIYQGGDAPAKIWWVGQGTMDHYGTYMVLEVPGTGRSNVPFAIGMAGFNGVLNTRFSTDLDAWRSSAVTRYLDLNTVTRLQVEHPADPDQGFVLLNQQGRLELQDLAGLALPMDTSLARDAMRALRTGNFEGFERSLTQAKADSIRASLPMHVLTVTSDRGVQRLPFWKKAPFPGQRDMELRLLTEDRDRMYTVVDDTSLVIVQRFWWDRILRTKDRMEGLNTAAAAP
jgi:hypothetical protein